MSESNEIPFLLQFMFGEAAGLAQEIASGRLLRWCRAMDDWLAERQRRYHANTYHTSKQSWRRLLSHCPKPPWEITTADLQAHIQRMQAQGYAPGTIKTELCSLSRFYRWCGQQGVDPACGEGFNPVAALPRPSEGAYVNVKVLGPGELAAFLAVLSQDESNLGRRDYAFFLARLHLGVRHKTLQQLRWEQIEGNEDRARVRWAPGREPVPLPAEVWGAIRAYLESSGRLAGMRPQDYIFAPLRDPLNRQTDDSAEDWHSDCCLTKEQLRKNLKLYGRLAGIPEDKLTMHVLRHTAALLCLEGGAGVEQMQAFLESEVHPDSTRFYLKKLGQLPREDAERVGETVELPSRSPRITKPGEGIKHGFYAQCQPGDEVRAMLAEDITGMEAEISGLRMLSRELLERQNQTENSEELAQLYSASTQTADRLRQMVKAEEQLGKNSEEDELVEQLLAMLDNVAIEMGEGPISEEVREMAAGSDPEMVAVSRRLTEEIASVRLVLRRAFSLAMEAHTVREQVRYTEIYGSGCVRLVNLLKAEGAAQGQLLNFLGKEIDAVIQEVNEEFGLDFGG